MRMTLYYMVHTVKNQIRKLFRTWVAVFLLVCLLAGVIFGLGAAALTTLFEESEPTEGDHYEQTLPDEESDALDPETVMAVTELLAGGIVLAVLFVAAFSADKSGSSIFQMADVNLLFAAPLTPQSVLISSGNITKPKMLSMQLQLTMVKWMVRPFMQHWSMPAML